MAKKKLDVEELQKNVKESAQKVWLAGLGALAAAEEEGGKVFKSLIKKGQAYESRAKGKLDGLREQIGDAAGKAKHQAVGAWDKVEDAWDDRVAATLKRIGVPSRDEIAHLTRRVQELTALVESKAKKGARSRTKKSTPSAARKTTAARRTR